MAQIGLDNNELQNRDDRLDTILNGTMRSAGNGNYNIGEIATSAENLVEDLVREITEKFEDALAGSSVDDSGELSVLSKITHQLNLPTSGEGLASFTNHALARLEERAANADGKGENIWSRITEERRRDEREKDKADEVSDHRQNARQAEQQRAEELRRHQEAWDNAPSSDYPGMSNREVLAGLRKIVANLSYYSSEAVSRGWIKEDEKSKFEEYMRRELWLKEQERNGNTNTPEYIAAKRAHDEANRNNPTFRTAARNLQAVANGMSVEVSSEGQSQTNLAQGEASIASGTDAFNQASTATPVSSSVAKSIDETSSSHVANVSPVFNSVSNGVATVAPALVTNVPKTDPALNANNHGFNMSVASI
jgi:hypothetical protein